MTSKILVALNSDNHEIIESEISGRGTLKYCRFDLQDSSTFEFFSKNANEKDLNIFFCIGESKNTNVADTFLDALDYYNLEMDLPLKFEQRYLELSKFIQSLIDHDSVKVLMVALQDGGPHQFLNISSGAEIIEPSITESKRHGYPNIIFIYRREVGYDKSPLANISLRFAAPKLPQSFSLEAVNKVQEVIFEPE